jgi:hypothetical protein
MVVVMNMRVVPFLALRTIGYLQTPNVAFVASESMAAAQNERNLG